MPYTKTDWENGLSGGTPINATNLDKLEDGVELAVNTAEAAAAEVASKAPIDSPTFTGTVSGITASMVGLDAVNNIADLDKPISTATQTVLTSQSSAITALDGRVTTAEADIAAAETTLDDVDTRLTTAETDLAALELEVADLATGDHTHTATDISDSTATGRSVLTAASATAARTAIGAGTSSVSQSAIEGLALWDGSAWPSRPTGYARIRWSSVGDDTATQPAGMVAGDIWEHNA